jgi:hypothetical protein
MSGNAPGSLAVAVARRIAALQAGGAASARADVSAAAALEPQGHGSRDYLSRQQLRQLREPPELRAGSVATAAFREGAFVTGPDGTAAAALATQRAQQLRLQLASVIAPRASPVRRRRSRHVPPARADCVRSCSAQLAGAAGAAGLALAAGASAVHLLSAPPEEAAAAVSAACCAAGLVGATGVAASAFGVHTLHAKLSARGVSSKQAQQQVRLWQLSAQY